ncbi:MAG: general stress protein [Exiguobacterium sp.]|uniref:General stress protein n=1 Tax=Exiguobacterium alkaliphilum TaxID=1428684 RepID=A0ABT2KWP7_9BACL|nr:MULTISPECIES: general stress protein [Exiguobacterium]MDX5323562.1 general stress protein [Exiguobacterium sp.]KDN57957.1 general stress protein [Exiguobacterium sp. AB2]MCT4794849.1 general stress protein [Exiguobacterium alkaliphilum]MDX5425361.1 general stress protein [Exiguobacterium sp.]MDX6772779.1 general stress protein [Exiguobacterium sp.]
MSVLYKEFTNDEEVVTAIQSMKAKGVDESHIYVITHDDDRTDRVADNADANTVSASDVGLGTAAKNLFRKKGDELRAQFEELGFSATEADSLEKKLDQGKVIVVVKDAPNGFTL